MAPPGAPAQPPTATLGAVAAQDSSTQVSAPPQRDGRVDQAHLVGDRVRVTVELGLANPNPANPNPNLNPNPNPT